MGTRDAQRGKDGRSFMRGTGVAWLLALIVICALSVWSAAAAPERAPAGAPPRDVAGADSAAADRTTVRGQIEEMWHSTGISAILGRTPLPGEEPGAAAGSRLRVGLGQIIMIALSCYIIYLAIRRRFEPLLLLPIGFGGILSNIPLAGIAGPDGFLGLLSAFGLQTGLFPLLIFMGVGAMTDFGPLIANPKTALLGAAAQFGIFGTLIGALALSGMTGRINFSIQEAAAIGIIGGADGPTAIYLAGRLAPHMLGAIAVAAYSYIALVPIIQPPIMKLLTTKKERAIEMRQLREVRPIEKILFPLPVLGLCILLLPSATPLIGMLMFGNLLRESGVVERLSHTAANELINTVTILLGLTVGSKLAADQFLHYETLGILFLGLFAFSIGTAAGVLLAKLMNLLSRDKINPLIGAAGVSAVPMASRVVTTIGLQANRNSFLLMHAMGPNVAGVIGSAVAAGVLLALCR
ncbi:MAG: sodium ion-translocating decarboxylase subunit beta [Candidatus Krumholzibacteria bacterium]|nr:sodium ion-translocating decarboxylase subunit beta [Candidatus Krumholzibacteria bacterium]